MAHVLAIRLGPTVPMGIMGGVDTGFLAVLSVRTIRAELTTFRMYGDSLYSIGAADTGSIDKITRWGLFLKQFKDKPCSWGQLSAVPPNPLLATSRIFYGPVAPPEPAIAEGLMTLTDSGYEPTKGWWIEFAGNFDLTSPLFRDFPSIIRNIPDYRIKIG